MRLNKYLSDAGVCSRRQADRLIEAGKVKINGETASLGMKVEDGDEVTVSGKPVGGKADKVYIMLNKPKGIECTTNPTVKNNIVSFVNYPKRIYPVGRLDRDSEGLILMTNDGDFVDKLMRGRYGHEKEYIVSVDHPITKEFMQAMSKGVDIGDAVTRPCKLRKINKNTFSIILTQGLNRQIRRMCKTLGYHVRELKRVRIVNLTLEPLKKGKWRHITNEEKKILFERIGKDG